MPKKSYWIVNGPDDDPSKYVSLRPSEVPEPTSEPPVGSPLVAQVPKPVNWMVIGEAMRIFNRNAVAFLFAGAFALAIDFGVNWVGRQVYLAAGLNLPLYHAGHDFWDGFRVFLLNQLVLLPYTLFSGGVFGITTVAITRMALKACRGEKVTVNDLWLGLARFDQAFYLGVVSNLAIMIGLFCCFLPGVWLTVSWLLVWPCFVDSDESIWKALAESKRLIKPEFGRATILAVQLCVCYAIGALLLHVGLVWAEPVVLIATTLIYLQMRAEIEVKAHVRE